MAPDLRQQARGAASAAHREATREPHDARTLLCLSTASGGPFELAVELAGDVSLEAPLDLAHGLALGGAAGDICAGGRVPADPSQHDGVQGAVELPVAGSAEAVPDDAAAGCLDRRGSGELGEGGLGADPAAV